MKGEDVNCCLSLLTDSCAELSERKHLLKCQQLFAIHVLHSEDPSFDCRSASLLCYSLS
jgi:hypothetical protein